MTTREIDAALSEAAHQKREAERKAKEVERRGRKTKRALAQEEMRRRAEEQRRNQEEEQQRLVAVSIIETIGEAHSRFLVEALGGPEGWLIIDHLRREVRELDEGPVTAARQRDIARSVLCADGR